jgi:cyclase
MIPVLLLRGTELVKTRRFRDPVYLGDAINAVSIFNEKRVDELIVLDIDATRGGAPPRVDFLRRLAGECFMPLCYGGGVTRIEEMAALFSAGVEKVSVNAVALSDAGLLREASATFGSQSIVASLDYRVDPDGNRRVYTHGGAKPTGVDLVAAARACVEAGAGEVMIQAIDRDGEMQGMDLAGIAAVTAAIEAPLIAAGGAGSVDHLAEAIVKGGASGAAAGAFFVFFGRLRAVLITAPDEAARTRALARAAGERELIA